MAGRPEPRDTPSTEPNSNPFNTLFDGDESEDEWWDEEDSTVSPTQKPATAARMTQWPGKTEITGVGNPLRPARTSTRKPDKRYSVQKPTRDKSKGRVKKQTAKAGIKVVTNFSRHHGAAPEPVQLQPSQTMPQMGRFVDLAALQALNGESTQPSGGFWKKKKGLARTADTMPSSPSNDPGTADTRQSRHLVSFPLQPEDDLSPNDRPIVIGISIPSNDMAEHTLSPQTVTSATSKIVRSYEHRTPTSHTPETPTIIITPAQESPSWSPLDTDRTFPGRRPQAASSIYSQGPQNAMGIYNDHKAPPVPQMPASVLKEERQRVAAQRSYFSPDSEDGMVWGDEEAEHASPSKSRVVSSYTVFEEDESPVLARTGRAVSISAKSAKRASVSTVTTRRRSRGWWNYITTPFLTRSNTVVTKGVFEDLQPPDLPSLAIAAAKAQEAERDETLWEKQFSPLTPETAATIPDSLWHSDSKDKQAKDIRLVETSPVLHETRHKPQRSSATIPFVFSEVAAFGVPTMSSIASGNTESQLDRTMTGTSIARSASGLSSSDREVPLISEAPNSRAIQSNNPYMQPSLGHLSDSTNHIRSATRQVIQPIRAAVVQAPSRPQQSSGDAPPPPYSPSPSRVPRYRAILPPDNPSNLQFPVSPGPLSPGMQQAMSGGGGIPMSNVPLTPPLRRPINLNSGYPMELPARDRSLPFTTEFLQPPPKKAQKAEAKRRRHEKEDAIARRAGGWWRGRGCIPKRGCYGRSGAEGRKRRRWYIFLITGFLSMMILVIVLATTLHRKANTVIGPSQWLNLTGFPPIYTGLSTVAAPVNIVTNTGCVFPATQWSCDLPKELQASVAPNQPSQPNFSLDIQWDNSSSTNATFANVTGNLHLVTRAGNPVSAGQSIKRMLLKARQIVSFAPNPAPPSYAEQFFLGNTTDGIISSNKAGEPTPFYISFLQPTNSSSNTKRQILERATDPFPNVTDIIPAASLNKDGTAAPANLLPFPSQQPIRLYDRGLPTEHYGFYTYFDRSIFLKSITKLNNTNSADGEVPDDENGGATEAEAAFRCTWAQTRFLVQMWTRMNSTAKLNNSTGITASSPGTDFVQPGSFPYPITITTDRHGGDAAVKMLYCYEMNDRGGLVSNSGQINAETRGFGGTVVNPAPSLFSNTSDPALGGYDGGTGGCSCQWSNFQKLTNT
jgi:hypothetical protein